MITKLGFRDGSTITVDSGIHNASTARNPYSILCWVEGMKAMSEDEGVYDEWVAPEARCNSCEALIDGLFGDVQCTSDGEDEHGRLSGNILIEVKTVSYRYCPHCGNAFELKDGVEFEEQTREHIAFLRKCND